MADYRINIYHLFPDLLTLCADKGNIAVLTKRCTDRGIEVNYTSLSEGQTPDFTDADIVLLGGGSESEQVYIAKYLSDLSEPLKEYIEGDGVCLALDSGFMLLGNSYQAGNDKYDGLKILDIESSTGAKRLTGNIVTEAKLDEKTVMLVGFENHLSKTDIKNHASLGKVICGHGNDGESGFDGIVYKNTVATYMGGPILPKNPELADYLIKTALKMKYPEFTELDALDDSAEKLAKDFVIERKLKK